MSAIQDENIVLCNWCFATFAQYICPCGERYFCTIRCMREAYDQDHHGVCPGRSSHAPYRSLQNNPELFNGPVTRRPTVLKILCYGDFTPSDQGTYSVRDLTPFTENIASNPTNVRGIRRLVPFERRFYLGDNSAEFMRLAFQSFEFRFCNNPSDASKHSNMTSKQLWMLEVDPDVYFGSYAEALDVTHKYMHRFFGMRTNVLKRKLVPIGVLVAADRRSVSDESYSGFTSNCECFPIWRGPRPNSLTSERFSVFFYPTPQSPAKRRHRYSGLVSLPIVRVRDLMINIASLDEQGGNIPRAPLRILSTPKLIAQWTRYSPELEKAVARVANDGQDACCICSVHIPDIVMNECGHGEFCCECVRELVRLARGGDIACPMCRREIETVRVSAESHQVVYDQLPPIDVGATVCI